MTKSQDNLYDPQGRVLTQQKAIELSKEDQIVILCGHYEVSMRELLRDWLMRRFL